MPHADGLKILNRLLAIAYRSLPMYLAEAGPWTHAGDEQAVRMLGDSGRCQALLAADRGGDSCPSRRWISANFRWSSPT